MTNPHDLDPTAVHIGDVRAALAHLGIAWEDVTKIRMDTRCITVVRYARDAGGRIPVYGGEPVTRTTAIAIDWAGDPAVAAADPSDTTSIGVTPR